MKVFEIIPLSAIILILVLISIKSFLLKNKGIQLSQTKKKVTPVKVMAIIFSCLVFLIWISGLFKPFVIRSLRLIHEKISIPVIEIQGMKIAGALIIIASLIFFLITIIHFKDSLRFGLDKNNRGKLITTGIFSISRNPFFLSLDICFAGIAIFDPSVLNIAFGILAVLVIHLFILREEKFLRQTYGKEYEEYTNKVNRYF